MVRYKYCLLALSLFPSGLPIVYYALTQDYKAYFWSGVLLPSLSRKVENARAYVVVAEIAKAFFRQSAINLCDGSERLSYATTNQMLIYITQEIPHVRKCF